MAINPALLQSTIQLNLVSVGAVGESAVKLATAVSNAYCNFLTTVVKVSSIDVGVAGSPGQGTGVILAVPPAFAGFCAIAAPANGMLGPYGVLTAQAIGLACGTHLLLGQTVTNHPTVAVGGAQGFLVGATDVALFPLLMTESSAAGLLGEMKTNFMMALSQGLAQGTATAVVTILIAGVPAGPPPVPSTGTGSGTVV